VYVFGYGPRTYQANVSYAIVAPTVPSEGDVQKAPDLAKLNKNNPYLRSTDPSLVTDVLIAKLSAPTTADALTARGLSPKYLVGKGSDGSGFVVTVTGIASSADEATRTTNALGDMLVSKLRSMQKVYGADDRYLFTPLVVTPTSTPQEQYSSRLRAVIVVVLAGGILAFGAVSAGRSFATLRESRRTRRRPGLAGRAEPKTDRVAS
jgi:hypothetical protein